MEHAEAVKLNAVERYLLGELDAGQRDAFEDHYFACMECAGEVKAAAAFIDNAREAMRIVAQPSPSAPPMKPERSGWFGWLRPAYGMTAVVVLAAVVGYQNLVTIPQMRRGSATVQALPTISLVAAASRGAESAPVIKTAYKSPFGVFMDIPASDRFSAYSCEIRTADGKTKFAVNVSAAQAKDAVELLVPGSTLDTGNYEVVLRGKTDLNAPATEEVARYRFTVQSGHPWD